MSVGPYRPWVLNSSGAGVRDSYEPLDMGAENPN